MPVAKSRVFCPACGLHVEPAMHMDEGYRSVSCPNCDLVLESKPLEGSATEEPAPPAAQSAINAALSSVMMAEDTEGIRKSLVRLLSERGIARKVTAASNGEELLTHYHRAIAGGEPVNLMILDVNMPILNGVNAAIGVRAAEKAYGVPRPTPILFFTSAVCDEAFKRVLAFTAPARYLNKGAEGTPEQFAERVVAVLSNLLSPRAAPA